MRLCCWFVVLMMSGMPVWAQTMPAESVGPQTSEEAQAQRTRAALLREEAERQYKADQEKCYSKFLVNDCLVGARKRYTEKIVEARKVEQPAREFEREAHRQEVAAKEAQRAHDLPLREIKQKEQAESFHAEQAAKSAEREKKLADKDRQAAEGRRRHAAEEARHQEKLNKRARKDAEREAKKLAAEQKKEGARAIQNDPGG